jgi:diguanylate cyclase (GGDEF)-like protein
MAKVAMDAQIRSAGGVSNMNAELKRQWCYDGDGDSPTSIAPLETGMVSGESAIFNLLDSSAGKDVRTLRAVVRVGQAVLGAQHFDDALEVIAEQSLRALDGASFSISRWERQRGVLRTLINVGELGPGEERWPRDEEYTVADDTFVTGLVRQGRPYVNSIDSRDEGAAGGVSLLRRRDLDKESELAVPVMYESAVWGELLATRTRGRRFGRDDMRLLEAIAAQLSVAIGRAELFSEVMRYAYEDPLTRLANRRGLDECLRQFEEENDGPTLLLCDLDGLKQINDRDGHPAGDRLLRGVAAALRDVGSEFRASLVARLGGDEFCVLLPASELTDAQRFACAASRRITREVGPDVSLCWGVATRDADTSTAHELISKADNALVEAKRLGPGRLRLHVPGERQLPGGPNRRRRGPASGRRGTDDVVRRFVELLDQRRPLTALTALELLAGELSYAVNAAAWTISITTDDWSGVRTALGVETALDPASGLRVVEQAKNVVYPLRAYPATARVLEHGGAFIAGLEVPGSDSAENEVLRDFGYQAVLGVGIVDRRRGYLLEVYSDGGHAELAAIAPTARVLAHYCLQIVNGRPMFAESLEALLQARA